MADDRPSLYIIDGHAHIYRAYFAPFRDLTSPTGEPTKATYVFTQMLMQLVENKKPDYLVMVIDCGDETVFRRQIDPTYKANRVAPPDDFKPQEERILQMVRDAGVQMICKPGFEADDVIATIAEKYRDQFNIVIVSNDKDLRQLIGPCCVMYDVRSDQVMDEQRMRAALGYGPEKAVEVQTLMGDNIDNIPGVPGVGEKTAARLIDKYGTADAVLDHAAELTPKLRENFLAHGREKLDLARKLVQLERDVPLNGFEPEACRFETLDTPAMRHHLDELGFRSLLARLGGPEQDQRDTPPRESPRYQPLGPGVRAGAGASLFDSPEQSPRDDCRYELVNTPEALEAFIAELRRQKLFAIDTETLALGALSQKCVGLSFSWEDRCGHYLPLCGPLGERVLDEKLVIDALRPILEDPSVGKIGHHVKYDLLVLRGLGIRLRGIAADTMLMAFLLDASRSSFGLDQLSEELLGHKTIPIADLVGRGKKQVTMDRVPLADLARYAGEDANMTWRLHGVLSTRLGGYPALLKLHDELEIPLVDVIAEMEWNGVKVDPQILREQSAVLLDRILGLKSRIEEQAGGAFNPDSPKQLQEVLFERLKLRTGRKTKTGYSTDAATLEMLAGEHPLPALILEYRGLVKLRETYLENLGKEINRRTGRIHTTFNQAGAATGRLSSSDPNLQNIPIRTDEGQRIRLAFVADEGHVLLTADYSQIELRMLAHFCGEERLIEAFRADEDIHRTVAAEVYGVPLEEVDERQRRNAKTINFAIIYGVSAFGLARRIDDLTQKAAAELIARYRKRFPKVFGFFEQCIDDAKLNGYVETIRGRRRPIPEIESRILSMRQYAERTAINSVIQGSAADLIKMAMVNLHRRMVRDAAPARLLLTVHDELVLECPESEAKAVAAMAREEMIGAMEILVPLKVDTGWARNWREAK
jgi:DNA polymerase-1